MCLPAGCKQKEKLSPRTRLRFATEEFVLEDDSETDKLLADVAANQQKVGIDEPDAPEPPEAAAIDDPDRAFSTVSGTATFWVN